MAGCLILVSQTVFSQISSEFWEEQIAVEAMMLMFDSADAPGVLDPRTLGYEIDSKLLPPDPLSTVSSNQSEKKGNILLTGRTSGEKLENDMQRLIAAYGKLTAGFITESDPGEDFADFTAGFLSYKTGRTNILLGNYSAGFGQGTVLWQGFDWGSYPEQPIQISKTDFLRGYSSTAENNALQGGALYYEADGYSFSAGYSQAKYDASGDESGVTSLQTSGLHYSESGRENKNRLGEQLLFGRALAEFGRSFKLGVSAAEARYSPGFAPGDSVREVFDFAGDYNGIAGLDFRWLLNDLDISGEFSHCRNGGRATSSGAVYKGDKVSCGIAFYDFSKDYWNLHSVIPEGNKTGYTGGLTVKPWPGGMVNLLLDLWQRPWRTYYEEMPPEGEKASANIRHAWDNKIVSLRVRQTRSGSGAGMLKRNQYRLTYKTVVNKIGLKFRFETMQSVTAEESRSGHLISTQANIPWKRMSGHLGFAYFRVQDYDCRIYLYEYDVPGRILVPFYYGNGITANAVYKWKPVNGLTLALKASVTKYDWKPAEKYDKWSSGLSIYVKYAATIY